MRLTLIAIALVVAVQTAGSAGSATFGGKILYLVERANLDTDLYVINADGSGKKRLARAVDGAAWSPDGRRIAYLVPRGDLYVMSAAGTGKRRVARNAGYFFSWSPEGRQLAIERSNDLFVINVDGTGLRQLTENGSLPAWSPDGENIAFVEGSGNGPVYVISRLGRDKRRLTRKDTIDLLEWSPKGQQVAVTLTSPWPPAVHRVNDDGTGQARLTSPPPRHADTADSWSANGGTIAFTREKLTDDGEPVGPWSVWTVNSTGRKERKLAHNAMDADWSPDGRSIAFVSTTDYEVGFSGGHPVMVMNANGTGKRLLARNGFAPSWQPVSP